MSSTEKTAKGVPTTVASIPLTHVDHHTPGTASIGELVKDATSQVSTLVRAEVALAKAEVTGEVKKAVTGSIFFVVAAVIGLYSTFFLFFAAAELLDDVWFWRWAAFLVVFGVMVVIAGLAAFLGLRKVKKVRKPEKTIDAVKDTAKVLPGKS